MIKKGKFIVIEGTDGSGKGTQTQLLSDALKKKKVPHKIFDFPRYEDNIYGQLVARYLKGEFGGVNEVSPYLVSLSYAGDRVLAKPQMDKALDEGKMILSNRYVLSNKAHQSTKLPNPKRKQFIQWLDDLEYKTNKLPREDLVIFLYLPSRMAQDNVGKKGARGYMGKKKKDIHENSISHLTESVKMYLYLSKTEKNWVVINCLEKNKEMKTREKIHEEIMEILRKRKII